METEEELSLAKSIYMTWGYLGLSNPLPSRPPKMTILYGGKGGKNSCALYYSYILVNFRRVIMVLKPKLNST